MSLPFVALRPWPRLLSVLGLLGVGALCVLAQADDSLSLPAILAEARREALRIPSLQSKAAVLAEIALRMDTTDPAKADELWQLAQECAAAVEDRVASTRTRISIARRLVLSTRTEMAKRQLQSIYNESLSTPVACHRAVLLYELYPLLKPLDTAKAAEALLKSEEAAGQIPEALVRANALARVAYLYVTTDPGKARKLAESAQQAWRLSQEDMEREIAALDLVRAWAVVDWDQALALTEELKDTQAKAQALAAAAEELAEADLDKAMVAVRAIASPELRALGLGSVACRLAKKRPDLAALMARDALASVEQAPPAIRDLVAAKVAPALASQAPDEAVMVLGGISDEIIRARAEGDTAEALAPLDPARAARLLKNSDHPELVESVWPKVIYQQARLDPAAARSMVSGVLERYLRTRALLSLWDALSEKADENKKQDAVDRPGGTTE